MLSIIDKRGQAPNPFLVNKAKPVPKKAGKLSKHDKAFLVSHIVSVSNVID